MRVQTVSSWAESWTQTDEREAVLIDLDQLVGRPDQAPQPLLGVGDHPLCQQLTAGEADVLERAQPHRYQRAADRLVGAAVAGRRP